MFTKKASKIDREKVDKIKQQALELGWTKKELYSKEAKFSFPCGLGWGLLSFLDKKTRIGEITKDYIEVINAGPHCEYTNRYFRWEQYYPEWQTKKPYGPDEKATIILYQPLKSKQETPRTRKAPRKGKTVPRGSSR